MIDPIFDRGTAAITVPQDTLTHTEVVSLIKQLVRAWELKYKPPVASHFTPWAKSPWNESPHTLKDMIVTVNQKWVTRQKMVLAANVPVTEEFRAETNKWMLEFFGLAPEIYLMGYNTLAISPRVATLLAKDIV